MPSRDFRAKYVTPSASKQQQHGASRSSGFSYNDVGDRRFYACGPKRSIGWVSLAARSVSEKVDLRSCSLDVFRDYSTWLFMTKFLRLRPTPFVLLCVSHLVSAYISQLLSARSCVCCTVVGHPSEHSLELTNISCPKLFLQHCQVWLQPHICKPDTEI